MFVAGLYQAPMKDRFEVSIAQCDVEDKGIHLIGVCMMSLLIFSNHKLGWPRKKLLWLV
jgi:hypothetical protein